MIKDRKAWKTYTLAIGMVGLVTIIKIFMHAVLPKAVYQDDPFVVFLSAVMISSWYGGFKPGLVTTLLAGGAANYLYNFSFYALDPLTMDINLPTLGLFIIEGLVISSISNRLRNAHKNEGKLRLQAEKSTIQAQEAVLARNQFLAIAAHELKNPLTGLMGYSELFEKQMGKRSGLNEYEAKIIKQILAQAGHLNKRITMLLDISRIDSGQFTMEQKLVNIVNLAHHVIEETLALTEIKNIDFSYSRESLHVFGDELSLEQVLQNLIQNALKYSPENGPIKIQIDQHLDNVRIKVTDQGIGIPEGTRMKLFQPFYRADNVNRNQIKGMGIGLYVVSKIIQLHNGKIEVESKEGQGSTFTVYLPVLKPNKNLDGASGNYVFA